MPVGVCVEPKIRRTCRSVSGLFTQHQKFVFGRLIGFDHFVRRCRPGGDLANMLHLALEKRFTLRREDGWRNVIWAKLFKNGWQANSLGATVNKNSLYRALRFRCSVAIHETWSWRICASLSFPVAPQPQRCAQKEKIPNGFNLASPSIISRRTTAFFQPSGTSGGSHHNFFFTSRFWMSLKT